MAAVAYQKILVGIDGSGHANEALKVASALGPSPAEITIMHVINEKSHRELEEFGRVEHIDVTAPAVIVGERLLNQAAKKLKSLGHDSVSTTLREGEVIAEILSYARDIEADLIILGCRGLKPRIRSALGSVSSAILHRARCNCIVVRGADV